MARNKRDRLLKIARRGKIIAASEAARAGIHSQELTRLVADGTLERVSRGRYRLASRPVTEHHALAVIGAAVPGSVICLISALQFHQIGTQLPADVWVAISRHARTPRLAWPRLRVVRFTGVAFSEGIEVHRIEGESVRIYSVAKTLADLFKHRNKVGLDVAIEALREAWRERRFTMAALDRAARVCRVTRVIGPYIEGIIS